MHAQAQARAHARTHATLSWLQARVGEFVAYLRAHHADDDRVRALLGKLRGVELLPAAEIRPRAVGGAASWRNGKFKHSTGVLYVAATDFAGAPRTPGSLLKTVVHELAHATRDAAGGEASHSPRWKQTWLWMLEIATQRLGWDVEVRCAQCTYYGLCERSQCPKCRWLANLCRPYAGPPPK